MDTLVQEINKQMSIKIKLQNIQMKATIKEIVNSTLTEFQSHLISRVEVMMTLQLEHINKSIAVSIKAAMQSSYQKRILTIVKKMVHHVLKFIHLLMKLN